MKAARLKIFKKQSIVESGQSLMRYRFAQIAVLLMLFSLLLSFSLSPINAQTLTIPTDIWAVKIAPGADPNAMAASLGFQNLGQVRNLPGYYLFRAPLVSGRQAANQLTAALTATSGVLLAEQQLIRHYSTRQDALNVPQAAPTDPYYAAQWHLQNTGQAGGTAGNDINVLPAWDAGFTGAGVALGVIDSGIEFTHPDLAENWLAALSYDYVDDDTDPSPALQESHGTAVSGIAAASDNTTCGVGVAYEAGLVGVRLVPNFVDFTDAQAASALAHAVESVDIYNNSWGPNDDGIEWGGTGILPLAAVEHGALTGRDGRGIVYVWAGGNGYLSGDHTGADSFVNSRYTIGVAATDVSGKRSIYSELGAALLVNAPSSGGSVGTVTSDRVGTAGYAPIAEGVDDCTNGFGGTSSAAPTVAGVVALMLQANPNLTWRDVQAILIQSAFKNDPADAEWQTNDAGYPISHKYGFGRVNAAAAVALAQTWVNLAPETRVESGLRTVNLPIPDNTSAGAVATFDVMEDVRIESVELLLNVNHTVRGDLQVDIIAPSGTVSTVLMPRGLDNSSAGIHDYTLLSMRHFGESSFGVWTVRVMDTSSGGTGTFESFALTFNGQAQFTAENLVSNGSFEANNPLLRVPDSWRANGLGKGDKLRRDTVAQKFAYEGEFAFQFKGMPGENARLRQDIAPVTLNAGDRLSFRAKVRTKNLSNGAKLRLRLTYADNSKEWLKLRVPKGSNAYQTLVETHTLPKDVTALRLFIQFVNPNARGKFWVDDVRVDHILLSAPNSSPQLIPLPSAPADENRHSG